MDVTISARAGGALRVWNEGGAVRVSTGPDCGVSFDATEAAFLVRALADVARSAHVAGDKIEAAAAPLGERMQGSAGATFRRGMQVDPKTGALVSLTQADAPKVDP